MFLILPNIRSKTIFISSILLLLALMGLAFADTEISGCATLNSPDTYLLNQSIPSASDSCITINVSNVILNCQGNTITYSGSATDRLIFTPNEFSNISIFNCNLVKGGVSNNLPVTHFFLENITVTGTYGTTLNGNDITMNNVWMNATGQSALLPWTLYGGVIENSTFISNASAAIRFYRAESGVNLTNNTFIGAVSSVEISGGSNNRFALNNFSCTRDCILYVNDTVGGNYYNNTVDGLNQGNIYANVLDGTVDIKGRDESSIPDLYIGKGGSGYPYDSTTSGGMVTSDVTDWAPLTPTQGLVCGVLDATGTTYNLSFDIDASGTCFTIEEVDITLDCNGFSIIGDATGDGISVVGSYDAIIKNCKISNFTQGVYLESASGSMLNNTVYDMSGAAFAVNSSSSAEFRGNTVHDVYRGFFTYMWSARNIFADNIVYNTLGDEDSAAFYISDSGNNIFIKNTVYNSALGFYSGSPNNLFIDNVNELDYDETDPMFYSDSSQNTYSSGNTGWWPLLNSDGSDATDQTY
ncbi:MAG: right-handed parallel beta-helix repeat-containing protein, partial [Candidatus ainarchaeum sp.]|nr:right-handed parallel beta-helix repeat-containing protein [Candidatus ainarchaeum sp.]